MICNICEQVSEVPTGTRIPTAFTNTLWAWKLDSGRRVSLICRRRAARLPSERMCHLRSLVTNSCECTVRFLLTCVTTVLLGGGLENRSQLNLNNVAVLVLR
jgi:hypothetical protein